MVDFVLTTNFARYASFHILRWVNEAQALSNLVKSHRISGRGEIVSQICVIPKTLLFSPHQVTFQETCLSFIYGVPFTKCSRYMKYLYLDNSTDDVWMLQKYFFIHDTLFWILNMLRVRSLKNFIHSLYYLSLILFLFLY